MTKRVGFATRLGAIAAAVGSAVGLGNIWRFPYEAGVNGGGAFILVYICCIIVMGIPVILSEFIIGRSTHSNMKAALKKLSPGKKYYLFTTSVFWAVSWSSASTVWSVAGLSSTYIRRFWEI